MPVTKYQNYYDVGKAGQIATLEATNIKTRNAQQAIEFGVGVLDGDSPGVNVVNVRQSQASLTYDSDFVVDNTIKLTVNGQSTIPILFSSDQATTFGALVSEIDSLVGVTATDGGGRTINISLDDGTENITLSDFVVTGGASQPVGTVDYLTATDFAGITVIRHGQPITIGGDDLYQVNDAVNVLTKGVVWVPVVSTVAVNDQVYLYADKANPTAQGKFTNVSTNNVQVVTGKFVTSATGTVETPALAQVEINQP